MCDGVRCLSRRLKVAADEVKRESKERPAGEDPPEAPVRMVRVELEWDVPMSVTLPVQVGPDPAGRPFPFLDTTLADLGIAESDVRERVVWVDTTKTKVKDKAGKLKEKETTFLEVRVKAQKSGDQRLQEVLYSTEAQTDRYFCSRGKDELPRTHKGEGGPTLAPQVTEALEERQADGAETQEQRRV